MKLHFLQAHRGLSRLQDQPVGSRESHTRNTLTAGEDFQTKVSTRVDIFGVQLYNTKCQSRTEEQLPVYQPPKKEEVVYSWEDFYPNKPVEVNFVLQYQQLTYILLRNARSARAASFGAISIMVAKSPLLA